MKSPNRKRLAALAALVVGAGAAVGLAAAPAQAQTVATYPITDGSIEWGVKASFRTYIDTFGGTTTATGGAVENADGTFTFGSATGEYDLDGQTLDAATAGGVNLAVPSHGIDITLENLYVEMNVGEYTGTLYADVEYGSTTAEDMPIVDIDASGSWTSADGYMTLTDAPTALTEEAVPVFQSYQAGQAMDPITIAVEVDTSQPSEDPGSEDPSEDTSTDESTAEPSEDATVYEVTGGDADWGVKESFRTYVTGSIANGEITVSEPATENEDGTYHFPNATGSFIAETCNLDAAFEGGVNFYGHEGELDLDIADLSVKSTDGGLALYSGGTHIADVAVTDLSIVDGVIAVEAAAATLSAEGADFFAGYYTEGTALDAVTFTVTTDAPDTTCAPTGDTGGSGDETSTSASGAGSPTLPTTGSSLVLYIAVAAALLAAGVAAMVLTRRRAVQA